ncbi:unnamed protein product [Thelazia callipaeda]|uniref:protein O-GlcNAcase n=1 Tax=Thelazia callipaeda TaxID=103827 RepID=A0A0N5D3B2_THECL|nr:unnamed protein product [Thelazia callipaeda]
MQTRSKTKAEKERSTNFMCGVVEGFYGRPWTADQRKDLFARMKGLGLNTYIYAPKDDLKHRAEWRQLYNSNEIELLKSLISSSKMENITFVYALSPGIDIIYSSEKEMKALHDKSEQVRCLGCEAFALLFDDIDVTLNDVDKKQFSSIADAQLTVANSLYNFLKCPYFFFCPTEYCESRANPSLEKSEYLLTVGKLLTSDIHIFWTGPRVVSREITVDHIRRVTAVLQRKPVIWDNLHANDYDPKRVFLGPFSGRTVKLKQEAAGILLNPNCRYEANFLPLYTLAEWNSCHEDAELMGDLESNSRSEVDVVSVATHMVGDDLSKQLYNPVKALDEGIKKWIKYLTTESSSNIFSLSLHFDELNQSKPSTSGVSVVAQGLKNLESNSDQKSSVSCNTKSTLAEALNLINTEYSEPMDVICVNKDDVSSSLEISDQNEGNFQMSKLPEDVNMGSSQGFNSGTKVIGEEQVAVFVDMFYLPFEHGRRGIQMLQEFSWLYENSKKKENSNGNDQEFQEIQELVSDEWRRRCADFVKVLRDVMRLYQRITHLPNRSAVHELFQYIYDAQGIISLLEALVLWMAGGHFNVAHVDFDCFCRNDFPDVEPWTLSGGFLTDLQKLLYSNNKMADLFLLKTMLPFSMNWYTIRPYTNNDLHSIDCVLKMDDNDVYSMDISDEVKNEYFFDRYINAYIKFATPRTCFVAAENDGDGNPRQVIAVVCAALNAKQFAEKVRELNISKTCKYHFFPKGKKNSQFVTLSIEEIEHQWQHYCEDMVDWSTLSFSDHFYEQFPSQIDIRCRDLSRDAVVFRRLIIVATIALSYNGSSGFFVVLNSSDNAKINLFATIGLTRLKEAGVPENLTLMGHSL